LQVEKVSGIEWIPLGQIQPEHIRERTLAMLESFPTG
jgi:hypothetical protein